MVWKSSTKKVLEVVMATANQLLTIARKQIGVSEANFWTTGYGKKIYFPREVLPISFVTSQFVNMLLSFVVILVVVFFNNIIIEPFAWLCLLLVMIIEYILCLGITLISSALTVYFRDLQHILGIISMAWMYLTPVLYPVDTVPERFLNLFNLNPMTPVTIAYRDILYYGRAPHMNTLLSATILGIIVLVIGKVAFSKLQRGFAEEL